MLPPPNELKVSAPLPTCTVSKPVALTVFELVLLLMVPAPLAVNDTALAAVPLAVTPAPKTILPWLALAMRLNLLAVAGAEIVTVLALSFTKDRPVLLVVPAVFITKLGEFASTYAVFVPKFPVVLVRVSRLVCIDVFADWVTLPV